MDSLFFHTPSKVFFGADTRLSLGTEARRYGSRALLITESVFRSSPLLEETRDGLTRAGVEAIIFSEVGEETTSRAGETCLELAKSARVQLVIGLGGVRTLALAKAVASLGSSIFDIDNLKDIQNAESAVYPYIEVPTTCRNPFMLGNGFFLTDARNRKSVIIRRRQAHPQLVLIDPRLSAGMSERGKAATALDTLLHSLEGFFSRGTNFFSTSIFLRSIGLLVNYIDNFDRHDDPETAVLASQAGFLSAFALTMGSPGIGSAVSICASGLFKVPKSGIAAVMLPVVLEYGRSACPEKIARMAPIVDEDTRSMRTLEAADVVISALRRRIDACQLPLRLSDYGIVAADLPLLASAVAELGLSDELPVPLSEKEILELLRRAL